MNDNIIITVSIAAYNVEKCLEKCLNSFTNCKNFCYMQILIENDGSVDRTRIIAEKYAKMYPQNIEVVNKKNGGHGSTINESIKRAHGKYFKVVDADDWVESKYFDQLIEYLKKYEVDLALNPYYEVDATSMQKKIVFPWKKKINLNSIQNISTIEGEQIVLAMHAMTFLTEILKNMKLCIDEKCYYVDVEYTLFPLQYVRNIVCLNYPVYDYLLGTATQSMNMDNLVKNRRQHLRVCKRVVEFYEYNKESFTESTRKIVKRRVSAVVCLEYIILLKIGKKQEKDELLEFEKYLKANSKEIYESALQYGKENNSGYMKIIDKLRHKDFSNFLICYLFLKGHKVFKQIKKEK